MGKGRLVLKYHCKIDLPGWKHVADECLALIKEHDVLANKEPWTWIPPDDRAGIFSKVKNLFSSSGITLARLAILFAEGTDKNSTVLDVHRDHRADTCRGRVNIPLTSSCAQTQTNFFQVVDENPVTRFLPNGMYYYVYNRDSCVLVDHYVLDSPTVINVTEPHAVEFFTDQTRISFTCFVDPDPIGMLQ